MEAIRVDEVAADDGLLARCACQKPFNLEGVDFNVDSLDVINLRSVKSELLLENMK